MASEVQSESLGEREERDEVVVQENQDGMDRERYGKGSWNAQDEIA